MTINLFNNWSKKLFWILIIIESISFWSYIEPLLAPWVILVFIVATFILSLKKLDYGFYILLTEIFLSSHGRLLSAEVANFNLSLRQGLFAAVLLASVFYLFKKNNFKLIISKLYQSKALIFLGIAVCLGIVLGVIKFGFLNSFSDWNAYLFLLIIPAVFLVRSKDFLMNVLRIMLVVVNWLFLKTYIYLFVFSHQIKWLDLNLLYKFFRDTRVGEITYVSQNFYRIFMPAQIFATVAVVILVFLLILDNNKKINLSHKKWVWLTLVTSLLTVMASFSRSNWLGLAMVLLILFIYLLFKYKISLKRLFLAGIVLIILVFANIGIMYAWTGSWQDNLVTSRLDSLDEAAFSSRQAQLKPLLFNIAKAPVWGHGFGRTVTYRSDDPRIKNETNQTGLYTTQAFEWGYLDIWLKIGLFGLFAYLALMLSLVKKNLKYGDFDYKTRVLKQGFAFALILVGIISIFSPYMNHPLGISLILINFIND